MRLQSIGVFFVVVVVFLPLRISLRLSFLFGGLPVGFSLRLFCILDYAFLLLHFFSFSSGFLSASRSCLKVYLLVFPFVFAYLIFLPHSCRLVCGPPPLPAGGGSTLFLSLVLVNLRLSFWYARVLHDLRRLFLEKSVPRQEASPFSFVSSTCCRYYRLGRPKKRQYLRKKALPPPLLRIRT